MDARRNEDFAGLYFEPAPPESTNTPPRSWNDICHHYHVPPSTDASGVVTPARDVCVPFWSEDQPLVMRSVSDCDRERAAHSTGGEMSGAQPYSGRLERSDAIVGGMLLKSLSDESNGGMEEASSATRNTYTKTGAEAAASNRSSRQKHTKKTLGHAESRTDGGTGDDNPHSMGHIAVSRICASSGPEHTHGGPSLPPPLPIQFRTSSVAHHASGGSSHITPSAVSAVFPGAVLSRNAALDAKPVLQQAPLAYFPSNASMLGSKGESYFDDAVFAMVPEGVLELSKMEFNAWDRRHHFRRDLPSDEHRQALTRLRRAALGRVYARRQRQSANAASAKQKQKPSTQGKRCGKAAKGSR